MGSDNVYGVEYFNPTKRQEHQIAENVISDMQEAGLTPTQVSEVLTIANSKTNNIKRISGKLKVYIAGKVTGCDMEECELKFQNAENLLINSGYEPINPLKLVANPSTNWNDAMRICIDELITCDAIYLLKDWEESKGASLEKQIADIYLIPQLSFSVFT